MILPAATIIQLDDISNRIASEAMLAKSGRDEGMIPVYSLIGQAADLLQDCPEIHTSLEAVRAALERRLDAGQPYDDATLDCVKHFATHFPEGIKAISEGRDEKLPAYAPATSAVQSATAAAATSAPAFTAPPDLLMDLQLEQNRELLGEFHAEAIDHLQQIEAALLQLEQNPCDPDSLSSIFRSFHTIKGVSGFLQLTPIHTLTHEVESLLDLVRNNKLALTSPVITEILRSRDAIQALIGQITVALEKGVIPSEIVPVGHLIIAVKQIAAGGSATPAPAAPSTHAAQNTPPPEAATESAPTETAAVSAAPSSAPVASAPPAAAQGAAAKTQAGGSSGHTTIRVSTDKLDSLMDVVGELVIIQSQLQESARTLVDSNAALQRNLAQVSRITKELQHTSMSIRMIPVKPTFQKMERLVRDLARDCGKKVQFVTEGEETELDRTVVEEINDPLVHMIRNSLDHGLESPEDRKKAGKSETGKVTLKAYHQGGSIVLELSDDGRGINPEKILAKARKQGLIREDQQLSREEIFNLIFLPGFSTAEKVTSISGRGVGMDVVRRNIEKLRGKIELESELGSGSRFRVILPLTMAIIDGLVVRVGEDRFILPTTSVQMAYRPARETLSTVQGKGEVLDLRGQIVPLHRLHQKFGIEPRSRDPAEGIVVVIDTAGRPTGLLVDEMVNKQEVVIKNLGPLMQGLPGVSGGAILGDGSIALILDPVSLLTAA